MDIFNRNYFKTRITFWRDKIVAKALNRSIRRVIVALNTPLINFYYTNCMKKILLLEDDEILYETLIELLEAEGFEVVHVKDGQEALDATFVSQFDLMLLDVNVPFINGFELLKELREAGNKTPAIFLTALTDISSLSRGFEIGADDYIKKPFDFDELLVRMRALLKKRYSRDKIEIANFAFDTQNEELYKDGKFLKLTPYEKIIAKLFFQNIGKTVSKYELLDVLNEGYEMSEGALRVHINSLRKIGLPIITLRGVGYRFEEA